MNENRVASFRHLLAEHGYAALAGCFSAPEAAAIADEAESVLARDIEGATLRAGDGSIYGARNVGQHWPNAARLWRRPALLELLAATLGPGFGLVRVLFFDKPPAQTWALPWHRDLTIAVRDNRLPSGKFRKPTTKGGGAAHPGAAGRPRKDADPAAAPRRGHA